MIGGVYYFNEDYAGVQITSRRGRLRYHVGYVILRRVYCFGDMQLPYDIAGYSSVAKGIRVILSSDAKLSLVGRVPAEHLVFFNAMYIAWQQDMSEYNSILSTIERTYDNDR